MKFHKYQDGSNEWRWRLVADNGKIIADSGEGYTTERNCDHGIDLVKAAAGAPIIRGLDTKPLMASAKPSQRPLQRPKPR
jgi:uncharacterized protein